MLESGRAVLGVGEGGQGWTWVRWDLLDHIQGPELLLDDSPETATLPALAELA